MIQREYGQHRLPYDQSDDIRQQDPWRLQLCRREGGDIVFSEKLAVEKTTQRNYRNIEHIQPSTLCLTYSKISRSQFWWIGPLCHLDPERGHLKNHHLVCTPNQTPQWHHWELLQTDQLQGLKQALILCPEDHFQGQNNYIKTAGKHFAKWPKK